MPTGSEAAPRSTGTDAFEEVAMGDKGKKDKEKNRKQKIMKQTQEAKKAQEKFAIKFPLSKA
jgi:hypothetical protein